MSTDKTPKSSSSNPFLTWEIMLLYCLLVAAVAVLFEKPSGSITGTIALEDNEFGLYSYNMRANKVYAVATGPRDAITTIARGAWVDNAGKFKIDQLPIGEYEIKVRAPGFETERVEGVFIEAGKIKSLTDTIKMSVLEPSVSIASNVRVFTTKENPSFWIRATGAAEATVKLYKKPFLETVRSEAFAKSGVNESTDLSLYTSYNETFTTPFTPKDKPFKELKRKLVANYEDSSRADFKFDTDLPPGDYFVVAECVDVTGKKSSQAIWWFTVSDIGLVVKHSPEGSMIRAIDLNTMQAAKGVNLKMIAKESKPPLTIATGVTGDDGIAFVKNDDGQNYESVIVGERAGHTAYGSGGYWYGGDDNLTTYFYTDRPVYRLGQTVMFKGISRQLEANGFNSIGEGQAVQVVIEDPSNVELYSGEVKTTKFGTFNGTFEIPENGKTGNYSVKLTYNFNGKTDYQYFEVDQYRKPEYKIEIKPDTERITAGTTARAILNATYFFGGPVANAKVKYSVYSSSDYSLRYKLQPRPDYYSYFDDWEGSGEGYDYGGSFVSEGVAQTDENGQAIIEFDTTKIEPDTSSPNYYYDYSDKKFKIEAEVTDISRLTSTGSGNLSVTAGDFALFVDPVSYVVQAGDGVKAKIEARDYQGKPMVNQKINVKISRWPYNSTSGSHDREIVVSNGEVTTDSEGKVDFSANVGTQWPTDTFYIVASAKDAHGNTVADSSSVWVASPDYPYSLSASDSQKEAFKISLDKKIYKPGEKARVIISGPFNGKEGYDALVTVEGTTLYSHRVVKLNATANLIEIPIEKIYAPNVYVGVCMVTKKKQFYSTTEMIMVSPNDHFVNIAIETDKKKYKPGEVAKYTLKATYEDGKPAPNTELSLGVVDESIYSIRAEQARDIRKVFYAQRSNKVNTFCSFPETYSGGPDKTAVEPKLRKNFKDTAAWFPHLVTDKNGIASAQVTLPDNLTTWRATVRGITMNCDVGSKTQEIMVTQDIIARLALPRFYTEGDQSEISAVVHNYTDQKQNVQLTLTISNQFKTNLPLAQNLSVEPEKAARFIWPVSVAHPGKGVIRLKAKGQTGGDYLERSLPVNALGIPFANSDSGVLTDAIPSVTISHADVGQVFSPTMTVNLAGSTIGEVQGTFDSLIDYPYGCTEQTMSRFMPSIVAMQLKKKLGVPLLPSSIKRFDKVREIGMAKLIEHHHSDGGWGWWKDDASDPYMTSLVLEGLNLFKDAGYAVDQDLTTSGLKWLSDYSVRLEKELSDPKLVYDYTAETRRCDMARLAYTLTVYEKKPAKTVVAWLKNEIPRFTPEPLSYTAMALKSIGDEAGAQKALQRLLAIANKTESTVDWEHTDAMMKRLKLLDVSDYTYRYTGEETTALALRAVIAVAPDKFDLMESIKTWLLLHRDGQNWSNTKTTSEVLLALLRDAMLTASTTGDTVTAKILMNNILANESTFTGPDLYSQERTFKLPSFVPKTGSVRIEKEGQGRMYYHTLLSYTKVLKAGEPVPVKNTPAGLSMSRSFYRLKSMPAGADGVIHVKTEPLSGDIKAGETLLMKVSVDCPLSLPYVSVECPLPSGAEVVESRGAENAASEESANDGIYGEWGNSWWSHQDVLDDKIVFFGTSIPQGKKEFFTLLRMELPGKVQLNPVTLEGMYTKLIRGYTQSEELTIK